MSLNTTTDTDEEIDDLETSTEDKNFPVLYQYYRVILPRDEPFYPCMPMPGSRKAVTKLDRNTIVQCVAFEDFLGCSSAVLDLEGIRVLVAKNGSREYLKHVNRTVGRR